MAIHTFSNNKNWKKNKDSEKNRKAVDNVIIPVSKADNHERFSSKRNSWSTFQRR